MNITQLAENFERDLKFKNYAELSIKNYSCQIKMFLAAFEKSEPKRINQDEIKDYLITKVNINSRKHAHSAVKLFYKLTVKQPRKFDYIEYSRHTPTEPILFSMDEVSRMFQCTTNTKHIAILATLLSTGCRRQELIDLKLSDFDKENKVIYIRHGKGDKFRKVPYNDILRDFLTPYYNEYKPSEYLFENPKGGKYSPRSVLEVVKQMAEKAKINKRAYAHLMRHINITFLCEQKENMATIREITGHKSDRSLQTYIHMSSKIVANVVTPLNFIRKAA